jgi:hypothetical protein
MHGVAAMSQSNGSQCFVIVYSLRVELWDGLAYFVSELALELSVVAHGVVAKRLKSNE